MTSQYSNDADGIIGRAAPGYGIPGIRVDGNDVFAVHAAMLAAKELALRENTPVTIEAMTYRMSHHSTSDDSSRYRDASEVVRWKEEFDPIVRLRNFMVRQGYVDGDDGDSTFTVGKESTARIEEEECADDWILVFLSFCLFFCSWAFLNECYEAKLVCERYV